MKCNLSCRKTVFKFICISIIIACWMTFSGCQYWYRDMKGFLEHWTGTVSVADVTWSASPASQKNASGVDTVSTNAAITAAIDIINPNGYILDGGIGSDSDSLRSVRISGQSGLGAFSRAKMTSFSSTRMELGIAPLSMVPTSESLKVEHTDFTLTFVPTRRENGVGAAGSRTLVLRYNTPPRMPLEVVYNKDTSQLEWMGAKKWELVQQAHDAALDGRIFWAYPSGITDPTHPDHVVKFEVYEDGVLSATYTPDECLMESHSNLVKFVPQDIKDDGYNIFCCRASTGTEIAVYAVDTEGVRSLATISGRAPHAVTLDANGGSFGSSATVTVYRADGSTLNGSDLDMPTRAGHYLSGWAVGGSPVTFPYTLSAPVTFRALWTAGSAIDGGDSDADSGAGSDGGASGGGAVVSPTYTVTFDAAGGNFADGTSSLTKTVQGNNKVTEPTPPTRAGWLFTWWKDSATGSAYDFSKPVTGNLILTANWAQEFYVNPGSGDDSNVGTRALPLKTIDRALEKVSAINDGTSTYTILLMGDVKDASTGSYTDNNAALVSIVPVQNLSLILKSDSEGAKRTVDAGRDAANTGRVFYVGANATVTLKDLVVTGGYSDDLGGGIHIAGGKVTLDTVGVSNNTSASGGGVSVNGGTLTMRGGEISNNKATKSGGGLFIAGKLLSPVTISGAKINGNSITYKNTFVSSNIYGGAALFVESSSTHGAVTINGNSEIKDNSISVDVGGYTVKGVALHLSGANVTTTIEDTVVSSNTIQGSLTFTANGGGIYLDYGTLNLGSGVEISSHDLSDTVATLGYSTVTAATGGGLHLEHGIVNMNGGSIKGNKVKDTGAGVQFNAGTFYMGGNSVVAADNEVYLGGTNKITIASSLTGTVPVATISPSGYADGVEVLSAATGANPAINMASEVTKFAVAPNPSSGGTNYSIIASGGTGVLGHYGESNLAALLAAAKSGDILDVRLTQGFNLNSPIEVAAGVTLNLSSESPVAITFNPGTADIDSLLKCIGGSLTIGENVTLDGNQQPTDNGVVYVDQGGTFTLRGKIISGYGTNAGGVSINGGSTFYMYDGAEIRACTATGANARQGGVRLSASTFYMYGGTIKDNSATYDAGVRVIDMSGAPSRFYMYGGEITGNSAIQTGGGVTVDKNCIFEMTGGSITGNSASTGPDVYSYPSFTGTISVPPGTNYVKG